MKTSIFTFFIILLAACTPAVPYSVSMETSTPDLYVDASSSRATARAALQQAQLQEQYLTATAQAPIVHITETAAALIAVQTQNSIDLTSTAVLWTPTPSPTATTSPSPTANATTTKVFAALAAEGTQIANNTIRDNLQLERERHTNEFWANLPGIVFALVAGILIIAVMLVVRRHRYQPATVDARGNVLPLLDVVDGTVTDVDRNPNYRGSISDKLLSRVLAWWIEKTLGMKPVVPQITAERQDKVTENDQMIDLATRGLIPESTSEAKKRKEAAGQQAMHQLTASSLSSRYRILDESQPYIEKIDPEVIKVLDAEWQEVKTK